VAVPGVGHLVHEEAPSVVAEAVLDLAGPGPLPPGADRIDATDVS
jgi:hypothetical protein